MGKKRGGKEEEEEKKPSKKSLSNRKRDGQGKGGEYKDRIDPTTLRYTHSKIRPVFADGRLLTDTLAEIESGKLDPDKMCNMVCIQEDGFMVSMNNRRLWVLKEAHAKGLLKDGKVLCRIQRPQESKRNQDRFTIDRCSLTTKVMKEAPRKKTQEELDAEEAAAAIAAAEAAQEEADAAKSAAKPTLWVDETTYKKLAKLRMNDDEFMQQDSEDEYEEEDEEDDEEGEGSNKERGSAGDEVADTEGPAKDAQE